ncbi:hypothetical protein [Pleomorphovibrio marinus]|uniref:hypothetical protein n=1 Tax=Pleomorphovibrio marinus TaxID=2164132 RepID=UPI000E0C20CC|nr:hypothetical protein [Pleomorphovibrio marinus]
MKTFTKLMLGVIILCHSGCGTLKVYEATVTSNSPSKNEVTKTNALQDFLRDNPKPKVVLRVPSPTHDVTSAEQNKLTRYYNLIEREFLKSGYTVRDRGLLTQLLRNGQVTYDEISRQIDTDLIIEVLDIDLCNDYSVYNFSIPMRNNETYRLSEFQGLGNSINCMYGKLEVRVSIVHSGELGGIVKTHHSNCDGGNKFYFRALEKGSGELKKDVSANNLRKRARVTWYNTGKWYSKLTSNYICTDEKGQEENIEMLTKGLIKELIISE